MIERERNKVIEREWRKKKSDRNKVIERENDYDKFSRYK